MSCIDRDVRRQTSQSKSLDDSALYLIHCLDYLIATVLKLIPEITGKQVTKKTVIFQFCFQVVGIRWYCGEFNSCVRS